MIVTCILCTPANKTSTKGMVLADMVPVSKSLFSQFIYSYKNDHVYVYYGMRYIWISLAHTLWCNNNTVLKEQSPKESCSPFNWCDRVDKNVTIDIQWTWNGEERIIFLDWHKINSNFFATSLCCVTWCLNTKPALKYLAVVCKAKWRHNLKFK